MPISREEVSRTVIARNLNANAEPNDIIDYFSFCGEVERVEFRKDQNSKSTKTALIVFTFPRSVESSLLLQDAEIDGRPLRVFSYTKFLEKRQKQKQKQDQTSAPTPATEAEDGNIDITETVEMTKARLRNYYQQAKDHETVKNTLSMVKHGWNTLTEEANKLVRDNQDLPDRIRATTSKSPIGRRKRQRQQSSSSSSPTPRQASPLMEFGDPFEGQTLHRTVDNNIPQSSDKQPLPNSDSLLDFAETPSNNDLLNMDVWASSSGVGKQTAKEASGHDMLLFSGEDQRTEEEEEGRGHSDMLDFGGRQAAAKGSVEGPKGNDEEFLVLENNTSHNQNGNSHTADNDSFDWFTAHTSHDRSHHEGGNGSNDNTNNTNGNLNGVKNDSLLNFGEFEQNQQIEKEDRKQNTDVLPANEQKNQNLDDFFQSFHDHHSTMITKPSMDTIKSTVDTEDLFGEFIQHNDQQQTPLETNNEQNDFHTLFASSASPEAIPNKTQALENELFGENSHPHKSAEGDLVAWGDNIGNVSGHLQPQAYALDTETLSSGSAKDILDPDELFGMLSSTGTSAIQSTDSADIVPQHRPIPDNGDLLAGMSSQFAAFGITSTQSLLNLSASSMARIFQFAMGSGFEIMMFSLVCRKFHRIIAKMGDKPWLQVCVKQLGIKSLPPNMQTWKDTYRAACGIDMMPNLVPHIRAEVHPNFENSILGLPLDFLVPHVDMVIPRDHFEAVMYGQHPEHQHQSAMFVNTDNDTLVFVRRCPQLEASILRVQQLPNGDFRAFEGRVRAEMAGGLQADALASDTWLLSHETWDKIRCCHQRSSTNRDLRMAQMLAVTTKPLETMQFGVKVQMQSGQKATTRVDKNTNIITAFIPPAFTDDDAVRLCLSIVQAAEQLACPIVVMPCGLDGLPSALLLRNLPQAIATAGLRRFVISCPSKSTCTSVTNTLTKGMKPRQIDQVSIMQPLLV